MSRLTYVRVCGAVSFLGALLLVAESLRSGTWTQVIGLMLWGGGFIATLYPQPRLLRRRDREGPPRATG